MNRRVFVALVGITTLAVVLFAVPFGVVLAKIYRDQQVLLLQREATTAAIRIPDDRRAGDPIALPEPPRGGRIAYYTPDGRLAVGTGPEHADPVTAGALAGASGDVTAGGEIIGAVPVSDDERIIGSVRITEPGAVVDDEVRAAWTRLVLLAMAVIGVAALVALGLARRLARPWQLLEQRARRLGDGDFTATTATTGIDEIDRASRALDVTASRLATLIERERRFSADASHQLRTPLTAIEIVLEAELARPRSDPTVALTTALAQAQRLGATIDSLLAVARDDPRQRHPLDVTTLLLDVAHRHQPAAAHAGRTITTETDPSPLSPIASESVITHILEVLIDNAIRHGAGRIVLGGHDVAGSGVSLTVADEGQAILDERVIFERRGAAADDHGIGLALALELAAAEGGRLRLSVNTDRATVFELLLPVDE